MPATTVLKVLSVGSNAIAPIDRLGPAEDPAVHGGLAIVALFVFQMPPFTVPAQSTLTLLGSASTAWTAPATGLFCPAMPAIWPPFWGAGPCATKFGAPN